VEQAVGILVEPERIRYNWPLITADILARAEDYIQRYRIFHEEADPASGFYRVAVQAHVARLALQSDLQAMGLYLVRRGKPTVVVLIEEVAALDGGKPLSGNRSQQTFEDYLRRRGFPVAEGPESSEPAYARALAGDHQAAARIGQSVGAEVVVVGKTVLRRLALESPTFQATISVRALESTEARIVVTGTESAVALPGETDRPEAVIQEAASRLAAFVADQLIIQWGVEETEAQPISLAIAGATVSTLSRFKASLRSQVEGVQQIVQQRFGPEGALLEVEYVGDASRLARAIGQAHFGLMQVEVLRVSPRRLELEFRP
jgi:hypothetical protein